MLEILSITGPVYLIIGLGFLLTRAGMFVKADMRVLGKFVLNVALPALLFNALSQRPLREVLHSDYMLAYAIGSVSVLLLAYLLAPALGVKGPSATSNFAMGMTCSNSGYMGYPILTLVIGPMAAVGLALNMLVENLLMLPLLMALADRRHGAADGELAASWGEVLWRTLGGLLRTPMIIAILLGFTASLLGFALPAPIARTVTLFSQATTALALFVIGGALVGLEVGGLYTRIGQIALGKLLLHPLAVFLVIHFLVPVENHELRTAAILFAAMPMLGIYPLLAEKHGHQALSAATLLVTTVLSFFSISTLVWLLR